MTQQRSDDMVPTWDFSRPFSSLQDPKIEEALAGARQSCEVLRERCLPLKNTEEWSQLDDATRTNRLQLISQVVKDYYLQAVELFELSTYLGSNLSVDGKNDLAKKLSSKLSKVFSELESSVVAHTVYVQTIDDVSFEQLMQIEGMSDYDFIYRYNRLNRDFMLNSSEEATISNFGVDGLHSWANLYNNISSSMQIEMSDGPLGLSQAASLLRKGDARKREEAWHGIQKAWKTHEESAAAILNSINGWRVTERKLRSHTKPQKALDVATHKARITRKTLDSLIGSTFEHRSIGQRATLGMAKLLGKTKLAPWDLLAPCPSGSDEGSYYSFDRGMKIIVKAFSDFNPEMGEFAQMMADKNWIDGKPAANKRAGAYCTGYAKLREPRVFITYNGSLGDVITLAHELGHAYHNWVMRDMPLTKCFYSMTLAETASIFAETLVRDYVFNTTDSTSDKLEIAWQDAESASGMICNIPARFDFERSMVEKRELATLTPSEFSELTLDAWKKWYGESLSGYDPMFWASKLHFAMSGRSFYNYPYLFGYLFSLGIYALKDSKGDGFVDLYHGILRDTGTMTAEGLIQKHLGENIEETKFWENSLVIVDKAVTRFESLIEG